MVKLLGSTIFFQATGYLLQFGAFFIFARILGSEGQGILTIFRALGQIIVSFMWVGLPAGIVYFIGKDTNFFLPLLKNCLKWFVFGFPLIILFLYIGPINRIPKLNLINQYIPYLLIFIFLLSFFNLFQILMLSLKKYLYYNLFAFGIGISIFGGSILISLVSLNYNKLTFAIVAYIVSYVIMFIYGFLLTFFERYKLNNERGVELRFLNQFKVGFRGFISDIAGLLLFRIDLFLVGYFCTFKEVGVYSIALFSAEIVTKIPYWSSAILAPMVSSNEKGHVRRTVYLFYTSIILALLLGLLFILIGSVFPDFISNIIGIDYKGVEICLLLLLPRVIMQSGVAVLAANLAGKGYPWYHPMGCIVPLLLLILFDFMLIPRLGVYGAALGSSLAFISSVIIFWIGFKKYNTSIAITVRNYVDAVVSSWNYTSKGHN